MTCPSTLLREARQGQAAEPALPGLAHAALSRALRILEHQLDNPDHDQDDHGKWADGMGGERDGVVPGSRGMPGSMRARTSSPGAVSAGRPEWMRALRSPRSGVEAVRNEGPVPGVVINGQVQDQAEYERLQAEAMEDPVYRELAETYRAGLGKQAFSDEEWATILTDERRSGIFLEAATLAGWEDPGGDLGTRMESMIDWAAQRIAYRATHLVSRGALELIDSLYGEGAGLEFAEGAVDWYDQQMRSKATEIADRSGGTVSFQQAIGLLAVTSPQTDWTGNMARAELLAEMRAEVWDQRPDWSQATTEWMEYYGDNREEGKVRSLTTYSANDQDEDGNVVPTAGVQEALQDAIDNGLSVGELIERHGYAGSMIVAVAARLGSPAAWLTVEGTDSEGRPNGTRLPAYPKDDLLSGKISWPQLDAAASGSLYRAGYTGHEEFRFLAGLTGAGGTGGVPLVARALTVMGRPDEMPKMLAVKTGNFALNGALGHYIGNTNDVIHTSIVFGDTNRKNRQGELSSAIYRDYGGSIMVGGRPTHATYAIVSEATQRATRLINDQLGGNLYPNQPQAMSWIDHRLFGQDSIGKRGMAWDEMHAFFEARGRKADKARIDGVLSGMGLIAQRGTGPSKSLETKARIGLSEYLDLLRKEAAKPGKMGYPEGRKTRVQARDKSGKPKTTKTGKPVMRTRTDRWAVDVGGGDFVFVSPGDQTEKVLSEALLALVEDGGGGANPVPPGTLDAISRAIESGDWIPDPEEEEDPVEAAMSARAAAEVLMARGDFQLALLALPGVAEYMSGTDPRSRAKQALTEALRRRARRAKRG